MATARQKSKVHKAMSEHEHGTRHVRIGPIKKRKKAS